MTDVLDLEIAVNELRGLIAELRELITAKCAIS